MSTLERPRRYRIILRGECGQLMAAVLDGLLIESYRGWTCVMALVHDESELYDLLDRFQDFSLHLVSFDELGADVLNSRASGRRAPNLNSGGTAAAEWLKRAVACDPATLDAVPVPATGDVERWELDMRADAMVRLAALVVGGEPGTAYIEHVVSALGHGVTLDEIVGVLVTLVPTVGAARATAFAAATLEASAS
jgi:alkylhydroperoxidase/carboxymuconolactone decarboxylase family protein YurZ